MSTDSGCPTLSYKNKCNIKGALLICPYLWPDRLKAFSIGDTHKGWKYYQGVIHNYYHGSSIGTDDYII